MCPLISGPLAHLASGGGTSAASLAGSPASSSSPWAGLWILPELSGRFLVLGGRLRSHPLDAQSSVGALGKASQPRPSTHAGYLKFAVQFGLAAL